MKKIITLLILLTALLSAPSLEARQVVITGNHVLARSGPGKNYSCMRYEDGSIVYLNRGDVLNTTGNYQNGYYQMEGPSYFWVSAQYVRFLSSLPSYVRVTGTHVRLRTAPSLRSGILTNGYGTPIYPNRGETLQCIGQSGNFWKVWYAGAQVWISKSYAVPY